VATNNYVKIVRRRTSTLRSVAEIVFFDDQVQDSVNAALDRARQAQKDLLGRPSRIVAFRAAPLLAGRIDGLVGHNSPDQVDDENLN
jgi:hypothetical protein